MLKGRHLEQNRGGVREGPAEAGPGQKQGLTDDRAVAAGRRKGTMARGWGPGPSQTEELSLTCEHWATMMEAT